MANTIKDANEQTAMHWETIQQWRIDEGKNFAQSRSSSIARMAAGGQKAGSEQWEANLAAVDDAHAKELTSQSGSATQGILDKWTADMKKFYVNATNEQLKYRTTSGRNDTPESNFIDPPKTPEELAQVTPRVRGTQGEADVAEIPGTTYEEIHAQWVKDANYRGGTEYENFNDGPEPPKSYEEAVAQYDAAVVAAEESGDAYYDRDSERYALDESGEKNVFDESGMTQAQFNALSTDEFMALQFGYSDKYSEFADISGEQAQADSAESARQQAAQSQTQRASPWWG